jgi:hypothetical protein
MSGTSVGWPVNIEIQDDMRTVSHNQLKDGVRDCFRNGVTLTGQIS